MWLRAVLSLLAEPPWPVLIAVTLCGWVSIVAFGHGLAMMTFCTAATGAWYDRGGRAFEAALFFSAPAQMAASWLLMLVAMMTPILAGPLDHLWVRSLARRRWRAIGGFLIGYLGVWMSVAPVLMMVAVLLRVASGMAGAPTALAALVLAFAWQASPWKQVCLNRCHWTPRLSVFGLAADRDCLRYGIVNAAWCVGTCWALMLTSFAVEAAHLVVMALAAAAMIAERLRPARPARWHVPMPGLPLV